jgi:branched-chain amino acid transport system substrate-binding protein
MKSNCSTLQLGGRHIVLSLMLTAGLLLSLTACSGSREPIAIGFAGELSGDNRSPSIKVYQGVELAVEQRNAEGGLHGRTIELLSGDDGGRPEKAPEVDRRLVNEGAQAIIGHPTSTTSLAALDYINESNTVTLSPTATADALFGKNDHFFTFLASNEQLAKGIAEFAAEELGVRRIALIYDLANPGYTKNYAKRFRTALEQEGGTIVSSRPFDSTGAADFETIIGEQLRDSPDALMILASSTETAAFLQQLYKQSADIPVLSCDWASTRDLIELGGPYSSRVYLTETVHFTDELPRYRAFSKAYRQRYGEEPSPGASKGYEAATVLLQALAQQDRGANLKEVLLSGSFRGFAQEITFDSNGDVQRDIYVKTVRDGNLELVR